MTTASEVVTAFMSECETSKAEMQAAFRRYFTPSTRWENVGMMTTTGPEEAIALMEQFEQSSGIVLWTSEFLSVAEQGNKVLVERVDHLLDAEGVEKMPCRIMGIFEVEGGKITEWRDYFDTAPFFAQAA